MASPEAIVRRCYLEKLVLKVKQNSQENIRVGTSFLTPTQMLSCEICEFFKNTYVEEHCERLLLYLKYYIQQQATLQKI